MSDDAGLLSRVSRLEHAIETALAELSGCEQAVFDKYERECFRAAVKSLTSVVPE